MIMKATLLLIACLTWSTVSYADEDQIRKITVIGTATTEVTPDLMHWRLKVKTEDADLAKVAENHSGQVSAALIYLKEHKIAEKGIQTSGMKFGENWSYQNRNKVLEGYIASTDITFKLTKLDQYQELWMGVSGLTNVSLTSVYYDHSDRASYERITRVKALENAAKKASVMANALNSKIGKALLIEEQNFHTPQPMARAYSKSAEGAADNSSLATGQIPITMRVKVSFQLVDAQ